MKLGRYLMVVAFCLFTVALPSAHAVSLGFQALSAGLTVGDSFDVALTISGLENDDLSTFDLGLTFDYSLLQFDGYTLGDQLGSLDFFDALDLSQGDLGGGDINLGELSMIGASGFGDLDFQDDSFVLATLSFTAFGAGDALFDYDDLFYYLGDFDGNSLDLDSSSGPYSVSIAGVVNPVPEPATLLLLGTGLIGLGAGMRRRRKQQ